MLLVKSSSWCGGCAPHNPSGLVLLDINKHSLQLGMSLWCSLKQSVQLRYGLHGKVLGDCSELAHLPGALMQCLQLQQDAALQLFKQL